MTIDEAILHEREIVEEQRIKNRTCANCKYCVKGKTHTRRGCCYFYPTHYEYDLTQKACCNWESNDDIGLECAEEHEQLAEWLEEFNELRKMREDIESNAECLVQQGMSDMLVKIRDYIYYECSADDSVTKVFEYLEQLK